MRDALSGAAIETDARQAEQLLEQALTQFDDGFFLGLEGLGGQGKRCAHAGNLVRRQGSGAQAALVPTAMNLRL